MEYRNEIFNGDRILCYIAYITGDKVTYGYLPFYFFYFFIHVMRTIEY